MSAPETRGSSAADGSTGEPAAGPAPLPGQLPPSFSPQQRKFNNSRGRGTDRKHRGSNDRQQSFRRGQPFPAGPFSPGGPPPGHFDSVPGWAPPAPGPMGPSPVAGGFYPSPIRPPPAAMAVPPSYPPLSGGSSGGGSAAGSGGSLNPHAAGYAGYAPGYDPAQYHQWQQASAYPPQPQPPPAVRPAAPPQQQQQPRAPRPPSEEPPPLPAEAPPVPPPPPSANAAASEMEQKQDAAVDAAATKTATAATGAAAAGKPAGDASTPSSAVTSPLSRPTKPVSISPATRVQPKIGVKLVSLPSHLTAAPAKKAAVPKPAAEAEAIPGYDGGEEEGEVVEDQPSGWSAVLFSSAPIDAKVRTLLQPAAAGGGLPAAASGMKSSAGSSSAVVHPAQLPAHAMVLAAQRVALNNATSAAVGDGSTIQAAAAAAFCGAAVPTAQAAGVLQPQPGNPAAAMHSSQVKPLLQELQQQAPSHATQQERAQFVQQQQQRAADMQEKHQQLQQEARVALEAAQAHQSAVAAAANTQQATAVQQQQRGRQRAPNHTSSKRSRDTSSNTSSSSSGTSSDSSGSSSTSRSSRSRSRSRSYSLQPSSRSRSSSLSHRRTSSRQYYEDGYRHDSKRRRRSYSRSLSRSRDGSHSRSMELQHGKHSTQHHQQQQQQQQPSQQGNAAGSGKPPHPFSMSSRDRGREQRYTPPSSRHSRSPSPRHDHGYDRYYHDRRSGHHPGDHHFGPRYPDRRYPDDHRPDRYGRGHSSRDRGPDQYYSRRSGDGWGWGEHGHGYGRDGSYHHHDRVEYKRPYSSRDGRDRHRDSGRTPGAYHDRDRGSSRGAGHTAEHDNKDRVRDDQRQTGRQQQQQPPAKQAAAPAAARSRSVSVSAAGAEEGELPGSERRSSSGDVAPKQQQQQQQQQEPDLHPDWLKQPSVSPAPHHVSIISTSPDEGMVRGSSAPHPLAAAAAAAAADLAAAAAAAASKQQRPNARSRSRSATPPPPPPPPAEEEKHAEQQPPPPAPEPYKPEQYVEYANRMYNEGRVPAHDVWDAYLGMYQVHGRWYLVKYDSNDRVDVPLPPEVLRESDQNLGPVQQFVQQKLDFLGRALGYSREERLQHPKQFMKTLVNFIHPYYQNIDLGFPEQPVAGVVPSGLTGGAADQHSPSLALVQQQQSQQQQVAQVRVDALVVMVQRKQEQRRKAQDPRRTAAAAGESTEQQNVSATPPPPPPPPPAAAAVVGVEAVVRFGAHAASQGDEQQAVLLSVPQFVLQPDDSAGISQEAHKQLQQILWHTAAAAAAAQMPRVKAAGNGADVEDPGDEWSVAVNQSQSGHHGAAHAGSSSNGVVTGSLTELRQKAREGRLDWGVSIQRHHDHLMLPLREKPYTLEDLHWPGVRHMPDFIIATGRVPLIVPPHSSASAAMSAAIAAVPNLVVPPNFVLESRCKAVLGDQRLVDGDLKQASLYIESVAASTVAQPGKPAVWASLQAGSELAAAARASSSSSTITAAVEPLQLLRQLCQQESAGRVIKQSAAEVLNQPAIAAGDGSSNPMKVEVDGSADAAVKVPSPEAAEVEAGAAAEGGSTAVKQELVADVQAEQPQSASVQQPAAAVDGAGDVIMREADYGACLQPPVQGVSVAVAALSPAQDPAGQTTGVKDSTAAGNLAGESAAAAVVVDQEAATQPAEAEVAAHGGDQQAAVEQSAVSGSADAEPAVPTEETAAASTAVATDTQQLAGSALLPKAADIKESMQAADIQLQQQQSQQAELAAAAAAAGTAGVAETTAATIASVEKTATADGAADALEHWVDTCCTAVTQLVSTLQSQGPVQTRSQPAPQRVLFGPPPPAPCMAKFNATVMERCAKGRIQKAVQEIVAGLLPSAAKAKAAAAAAKAAGTARGARAQLPEQQQQTKQRSTSAGACPQHIKPEAVRAAGGGHPPPPQAAAAAAVVEHRADQRQHDQPQSQQPQQPQQQHVSHQSYEAIGHKRRAEEVTGTADADTEQLQKKVRTEQQDEHPYQQSESGQQQQEQQQQQEDQDGHAAVPRESDGQQQLVEQHPQPQKTPPEPAAGGHQMQQQHHEQEQQPQQEQQQQQELQQIFDMTAGAAAGIPDAMGAGGLSAPVSLYTPAGKLVPDILQQVNAQDLHHWVDGQLQNLRAAGMSEQHAVEELSSLIEPEFKALVKRVGDVDEQMEGWFWSPVEGVQGYANVVQYPLCIAQIYDASEGGRYKVAAAEEQQQQLAGDAQQLQQQKVYSWQSFYALAHDVQLIITDAHLYNDDKGGNEEIVQSAEQLQTEFIKQWVQCKGEIEKKVARVVEHLRSTAEGSRGR